MEMFSMLIINLVAGILSTMNILVFDFSDIRFHLNDIYMVSLMTSFMFFFYSLFIMKHNHITIYSVLSILVLFFMIRNQVFITKNQFIKGMIPHHSMAITMAEKMKKKIKTDDDPEFTNLLNNIINSQSEEIIMMKKMEKKLI